MKERTTEENGKKQTGNRKLNILGTRREMKDRKRLLKKKFGCYNIKMKNDIKMHKKFSTSSTSANLTKCSRESYFQ